MRKSAIVFLFVVVLLLTGCKDNTNITKVTNTTSNTKEQVMNILGSGVSRVEEITLSDVLEEVENEYPMTYQNINYVDSFNVLNIAMKPRATFIYNILDTIYNDIDQDSSFTEDSWREISNEELNIQIEYKIFINDEDIHIQYYYINDDSNIVGINLQILMTDTYHSFNMNMVEYNPTSDKYIAVTESKYVDDHQFTENFQCDNENGDFETDYIYLNFYTEDYRRAYLKEGPEYTRESYSEYYSDDLNALISVDFDNSDRKEIVTFTQYMSGEVFYSTERIIDFSSLVKDELNFKFNVKYTNGWDTIRKLDSGIWMYNYNDIFIDIGPELTIIEEPTKGVFIVGSIDNDEEFIFDLAEYELYPPIYYYEHLEMEEETRFQLDEVFFDEVYNNDVTLQDLLNESIQMLYRDEIQYMSTKEYK